MPRFAPQLRDRPVIAIGETKYHGDPVAAVAAETKDAAEAAAALVRVVYEELPAVSTIGASLSDDAPLVQDPSIREGDPLARTNVLREHHYGWGDVSGQEARADLEKSRQLLANLTARFEHIPGPHAELGRTYTELGRLERAANNGESAKEWFNKAVAELKTAQKLAPANARTAESLQQTAAELAK